MDFKPKTEKEFLNDELWPDGIYSFQIAKAEEKTSKAGNTYISLTLNVVNDDGRSRIIHDMVMPGDGFIGLKLMRCCQAIGLSEKYESGS